MRDLSEIKDLLRAFDSGKLKPAQFIKRYNALWRELRDEQYAEVDTYGRASISDSAATEAVSQLFAEMDGYREQPDAPGEAYLSLGQLHQAVRETLQVLEASP